MHTGSIMLNENETFIIDTEFAFMGPAAFDLGLLLANLITIMVAHRQETNYLIILEKMVKDIWNVVCKKLFNIWQNNLSDIDKSFLSNNFHQVVANYLNNLLHDSIGFAGMEVCRRICGIAGVKELRGHVELEPLALAIGQNLVENYLNYNTIEQFIQNVRMQIKLNSKTIC